ncbi:MAG: DUF418 domain-containing protein [Pseudonocardia sp.]
MTTGPVTDPGATPVTTRALAPDLARGGMLLLIALANVHLFVYGSPLGVRGYPRDLSVVDRVVAAVQLTLVDGRAYPLFGVLFGYGIVQLTRRRAELGVPERAVRRLVRRRGWWMLAIGAVHATLLWAGDIVGAYGLLAVLMAGLLVARSDRALLITAAVGAVLVSLFYAGSAFPFPGSGDAFLPSMTVTDPLGAALARLVEWVTGSILLQAFSVFGAVALGAWAARRRILDDPHHHRRLLRGAAVLGLAAAVLGGLPLALIAAQVWVDPPLGLALLAGTLHAAGGYLGGVGYAAAFGLVAIRLAGRSVGPLAAGLQACGQRSLSCYLAQSVAFVALLPAWTFGLGEDLALWKAALYGLGTWLTILLVAAWSARAGYRGPAEVLLRRLTYGPPPTPR